MNVAQSILGHSGIAITMDFYSHLQPGMRDEALRAVSERLLATVSSNETPSKARETAGSDEKDTRYADGEPKSTWSAVVKVAKAGGFH
jgi:hypothetical protein